MNNKDIRIHINHKRKCEISVFCNYPENPEDHDVLDGEFDVYHINCLWGMLQKYADIENLDLQDLNVTFDGDLFLESMIIWTPDNKRWIDVPERFYFIE